MCFFQGTMINLTKYLRLPPIPGYMKELHHIPNRHGINELLPDNWEAARMGQPTPAHRLGIW
jgi:hypothetical protein